MMESLKDANMSHIAAVPGLFISEYVCIPDCVQVPT
jgi:hypothetical protein